MECPLIELFKKITYSKKKPKKVEKRFFRELAKIGDDYDNRLAKVNTLLDFMDIQNEIVHIIATFEIILDKTTSINPENKNDIDYLYSEFRQIWALIEDSEKTIIKRLVNNI